MTTNFDPPQPIGREEEKEGALEAQRKYNALYDDYWRSEKEYKQRIAHLRELLEHQTAVGEAMDREIAAKDKQIAELQDTLHNEIKERDDLIGELNYQLTTLQQQAAEIAEKSWDAAVKWARYKQKVQLGIETVIPPDKSTYLKQFNQQK